MNLLQKNNVNNIILNKLILLNLLQKNNVNNNNIILNKINNKIKNKNIKYNIKVCVNNNINYVFHLNI